MSIREWANSTADYSRKLLHSGREGAARGRESFLHGTRLGSYLHDSAREALQPAALGACIGVLGRSSERQHGSTRQRFIRGFLGGVIGFSAGVLCQTRRLAASVAAGALKDISRARDDHWLERNPIDYA